MKIEIINSTKHKIPKNSIINTSRKFLDKKKITNFQLGIHIVGGFKIRTLNKKFLGRDKITDVLSFPQIRNIKKLIGDNKSPKSLGDVFVCYGQCAKQAKDQGKNTEEELLFLVEHGLKHLIGIHHK